MKWPVAVKLFLPDYDLLFCLKSTCADSGTGLKILGVL